MNSVGILFGRRWDTFGPILFPQLAPADLARGVHITHRSELHLGVGGVQLVGRRQRIGHLRGQLFGWHVAGQRLGGAGPPEVGKLPLFLIAKHLGAHVSEIVAQGIFRVGGTGAVGEDLDRPHGFGGEAGEIGLQQARRARAQRGFGLAAGLGACNLEPGPTGSRRMSPTRSLRASTGESWLSQATASSTARPL
jgi:hypothetical protein